MMAWVSGRFSLLVFSRSEIGNRIEPEAIHAEVEPATHGADHLQEYAWIVIVEVWLMRKEAVPVVGAGVRIPGPVGFFGVAEDDARVEIALIGIAPDVPVARVGAGLAAA